MYSIAMRFSVLFFALTPSIILADAPPLPPPYEGVYQPQGVDEVGFWQRDDESERAPYHPSIYPNLPEFGDFCVTGDGSSDGAQTCFEE